MVPISQAGLKGIQSLIDSNNAGKGSQQIKSLTSGKGSALGAECGRTGMKQCRNQKGLGEAACGRARINAGTFLRADPAARPLSWVSLPGRTNHCNGLSLVLADHDFCPVL